MTKHPIAHASWLIIAVIIMAISGWYYVSTDNPYILDKQALNHMPDIVAYNVHLTQYDKKGIIKHDLKSVKMSHLPANDRYLFYTPTIQIINDDSKKPWHITSRIAISTKGGELIELVDAVHLHQQTDINKYNDIVTERLYYKPKIRLAYTDQAVEFKQPGSTIKAIGMQAELDNKHVKLLSRTQGAFNHASA